MVRNRFTVERDEEFSHSTIIIIDVYNVLLHPAAWACRIVRCTLCGNKYRSREHLGRRRLLLYCATQRQRCSDRGYWIHRFLVPKLDMMQRHNMWEKQNAPTLWTGNIPQIVYQLLYKNNCFFFFWCSWI